jgi:hypothetical protein
VVLIFQRAAFHIVFALEIEGCLLGMGFHKATTPPQKTRFNRAYRIFKICKKLADLFGQVLYFCVRRLMARRRHTQNFIAHAKAQSIAKPACDYFLDIRTKEHNASRPLRLCVKKICSYVLLSKKLRSSAKRVSQRKQREAFLPPYHTLKTNRRLIQFNMELN